MLQAQKGAPNGDFPTLRGGSVGVRPGCFMTTGSSSNWTPGLGDISPVRLHQIHARGLNCSL